MHRTRLAKLEFLHASRIATFGLLGFGLLVVGIAALLGGLTLSINYQGEEYNTVLELSTPLTVLLLAGGLASVGIFFYSLVRMERAQDRIIDMKLRSDKETEEILKYEYQDYKRERDLRFALSPLLMVFALIISGVALTLWMNEIAFDTSVSSTILYLGLVLGLISLGDQLFLWINYQKGKDKQR
jgi:hypothetical protein